MHFVLFFVLLSNFCFSQHKEIKTLDDIISKSNSFLGSDLDSALFYNTKAYELNHKIGNDYYRARCIYNFGNINYLRNNYEKAIIKANEAIVFAEKSDNEKILLRANGLLGLIYYEEANYNRALKHYTKALKFADKTNEEHQKAIIYNNLGNLLISKKDTANAIKYYQLNAQISKKLNDTFQQLGAYNNMAIIEIERNPALANTYLKKALELALASDNHDEIFNIYINKINLLEEIKDYDEMLKYLKKAEIQVNKIDYHKLFYLYYSYGAYYNSKGEYKTAIKYYEKANNIYNKSYIPFEQKISLLEGLKNVYHRNGDYQKAYDYGVEYHKVKDSIFSLEKEKDFNQLQTKYEVTKKNDQIQLLSKEKEIEKQKRKLWIGGLSLILLFSGLFFINRYQQQKKIGLKNQAIQHSQGIIEGQIDERNRVSKELHDAVAGNLIGINHIIEQENEKIQNEKLTEVHTHLSHIYEEVREISHNLNSSFIEDKSFKELLFRLKHNFEKKNLFCTEMIVFPDNALDEITGTLKTDLYRIFQELFTNIRKHANANNVEISWTKRDDYYHIIIEDDGKGFKRNSIEGIGIQNIRKRLSVYGGKLNFEHHENNGTTAIIQFKNQKA